jgi:hypothetical protein
VAEIAEELVETMFGRQEFFAIAKVVRKRRLRRTCFQLDGLKFQGSRSSILACG